MKILVAEDEPMIGKQYQVILQDRGHEVVLTEDGLQCVKAYNDAIAHLEDSSESGLISNPPFDVVILDYRLPRVDGLDAAKLILAANKRQRIIFASAYVMSTLQESVKHLQTVVEIIEKPFDLEKLILMVEEAKPVEGNGKPFEEGFDQPLIDSQYQRFAVIDHEAALARMEDAKSDKTLLLQGASFARKGELIRAFECFLKVIDQNPNSSNGWYNLAICLGMLCNRHHDSLINYCYDRALQLDPQNVEAWNNKGAILELMGGHNNALVCYERALEIRPGYPSAMRNLELLLKKLGRDAESKKYSKENNTPPPSSFSEALNYVSFD